MSGVDLFKLISALFVASIHISPLADFFGIETSDIVSDILFRWCVPFFFICSGYFMPNPSEDCASTMRYAKRLFTLYAVWVLIYYVFSPIEINFEAVMSFVFRDGGIGPFWFFPSLIFSVLTATFLLRHFKTHQIILICVAFYFLSMCGDSYSNTPATAFVRNSFLNFYYEIFGSSREGFLFGTVYIVIGKFIKKYSSSLTYRDGDKAARFRTLNAVIIIASFILQTVEVILLTKYNLFDGHTVFISCLLVAPALFVFALNIRIKKELSLLFRRFSILIYVMHWGVVIMLPHILNRINVNSYMLNYLIVLFVCFCASCIIIYGSKRYDVLRKLY